jgi:hypothetical protein
MTGTVSRWRTVPVTVTVPGEALGKILTPAEYATVPYRFRCDARSSVSDTETPTTSIARQAALASRPPC